MYKFRILTARLDSNKKNYKIASGLVWDLNPGPLAPKARIIPLDH